MTITPPTTSLTDHIAPVAMGAHVLAAGFFKETPVFVDSEGAAMVGDKRTQLSDQAILTVKLGKDRLLAGDDAGHVVALDAAGKAETLGDEKGKWIDAVALGPDGAAAWSAGKKTVARDGKGNVKTLVTASTARGLTFRPKGYQLAIAQNGGALLWMPNTQAAPDMLEWKGSHLDVTFSPDARFLVTSMQENALHGWRLPEKAHMRMTGYPAKTRSFSWSHDGNWLATSGADACIVWPFMGKDGPMGKAPRECGVRPVRVSCVAFHPAALVVALGYEDGCILLCRLTDASELLARAPDGPGSRNSVTALGWDGKGKRLAFGTAQGPAGVLTLPS